MNENKELFETMPIPKALATLAIPTIITQLIAMVYNLADTFFIGRTNDPYKVAAVSLSFVMFFVTGALANLFGVGGGSLLSRLLGKKQPEEAKKACAFSIFGTIIVSLCYSSCCYIFMEQLLRLMGASDATIGYASSYCFWVVVVGGLPATLSTTMAHILRSEGHSTYAGFGLSMGGIINIILDPIFMFIILPAGQEVTGAALATMFSNICSLLYFTAVFIRLRKRTVLSVAPKYIFAGTRYAGEVLAVGFPSALSSFFACISNIIANNLASGHSDISVAAMGIVQKINMFPLNVGMGLCQGMMPLVAYNYAAQNYKRMNDSANFARILGMGFAALCVLFFELFANGMLRLFISENTTIELGTQLLRLNCLATPLMICNFQMAYTFQAMGKGFQSLLLSACRQGLFNIPLLFLMNYLMGIHGIAVTQFLADGITLILSFTLYKRLLKQMRQAQSL